jgi:hypothetical protein
VLASSLGFIAASAFVSDERALNIGIGAAQPRLANLVQGDWLSGLRRWPIRGAFDHLMRAGPFDDSPGTSRLVRVQFVDPVYRDRAHQDTQGIGKILTFQHDPTWFFGFMDVGRSGKRAGKCSLRKSSE